MIAECCNVIVCAISGFLLLKWYRSAARNRKEISDPIAMKWVERGCRRSHGVRAQLAVGIVGVVLINAKFLYPLSLLPDHGRFLRPIGWTLIVVSYALARWRHGRFAREIRESDYRVCIQCGYSLNGLADDSRCPECGLTYTRDSLIQYWEAVLRRRIS
jgi:hypothetical protein